MNNFKVNFIYTYILNTFQVIMHKKSPLLLDWINVSFDPSQKEKQELDELSNLLQDHVWDWNEEELKMKFIGPLLRLVDFENTMYQSFYDREISVTVGDESLKGIVDFFVATGKRSPKQPYFFIHEYKKEKETSCDPLGQLLIAMIAGQMRNDDDNELYGAYVMGRFWFFVVLKGKEYSISKAYNAEAEEIVDILGILKHTSEMIHLLIQKRIQKT